MGGFGWTDGRTDGCFIKQQQTCTICAQSTMIRFIFDDHLTGIQNHRVSLKGNFHCKTSYLN